MRYISVSIKKCPLIFKNFKEKGGIPTLGSATENYR
jgi:hypothetical protein